VRRVSLAALLELDYADQDQNHDDDHYDADDPYATASVHVCLSRSTRSGMGRAFEARMHQVVPACATPESLTDPDPGPYAPPVADFSPARRRWAFRPTPPEPRSIVELIATGTFDAELAAQLWLLIEARVPMIVAAQAQGAGKSTLLAALLDFLPPATRVVELAGESETFDWLPQASDMGWPGIAHPSPAGEPARPETTVIVATELSDHTPAYTWGLAARIAVRAASIGYGLAATIHADSLDDVFDLLHRAPVRLADDELSHLGLVLVLRRVHGGRRRVVAAHYVRPVARDQHGHLQRLGPAVLATWDPATDAFEHFGWGVTPELAMRIGRPAGDFEIEVDRRRDYLAALVRAGVTDPAAARAAIRDYRPAPAFDAPRSDA
jgi:energy-coupling factor transporter ATP-binding protein EcfA2